MKLVVLTQDGVINRDNEDPVEPPDEWTALPGSIEAIAALNRASFPVTIASNQSGLARGLFDIDHLNTIHRKIHDDLEKVGGHLEMVVFCPHGPSDDCSCRKPRPGMLRQIAERTFTDLTDMIMIGAYIRDLQAALHVGSRPLLVLSGSEEAGRMEFARDNHIPVYPDLARAVDALLSEHGRIQ
ncbi:MAG: D-glycero-beta-D-manno-heptose 1,7-bisphosphate 7-phosphatase [Gammaproteobacteria bacterium]|nr:D-glycero-beta-D-manno-heptose 1,7-bisphosphate 7-phosphatase [Gammaproteobacteria bacterium]